MRHSQPNACRSTAGALLMAAVLIAAVLIAGCATTPDITVNSAPDANFYRYTTFGFPAQTGTDRGGYSTLTTQYFKEAVRQQMEARGFRYVERNPDLLVNFYTNVRERTEVRSVPGPMWPYGYYGYYGYRYGLYDPWPMYMDQVETVTYPVGTANIDIVDAAKRQMIWEGVAQGRINKEHMDKPREAISNVVAQLFERFPGRALGTEQTPVEKTPADEMRR